MISFSCTCKDTNYIVNASIFFHLYREWNYYPTILQYYLTFVQSPLIVAAFQHARLEASCKLIILQAPVGGNE